MCVYTILCLGLYMNRYICVAVVIAVFVVNNFIKHMSLVTIPSRMEWDRKEFCESGQFSAYMNIIMNTETIRRLTLIELTPVD